MMEALSSSEKSVLTSATRRNILETTFFIVTAVKTANLIWLTCSVGAHAAYTEAQTGGGHYRTISEEEVEDTIYIPYMTIYFSIRIASILVKLMDCMAAFEYTSNARIIF
jgi:hypothetical protein